MLDEVGLAHQRPSSRSADRRPPARPGSGSRWPRTRRGSAARTASAAIAPRGGVEARGRPARARRHEHRRPPGPTSSATSASATHLERAPPRPARRSSRLHVQQHQHEQEQHHDRARVDDHLQRGDERRAQQAEDRGERAERHDERERAVDRVALADHHQRRADARSAANDVEEDGWSMASSAREAPRPAAVIRMFSGGHRDQHLPAEVHELVVAEARQRAAQPDEEEQHERRPSAKNHERTSRAGTGHAARASRRGTGWCRAPRP